MAARSVFFRLMSDNAVMRTPMLVRAGIVTVTPSAASVSEGRAIPVTKPVLDSIINQPTRVGSLIICTDELLRDIGSAGQALLSRELANALAIAVDVAFLGALMGTGVSTTPSSGSSAVNAYTDLRNAMLAVDSGATSKLYWLASASVAKRAAGLADSAGSAAFSAMSPQGGELCGQPCIVSDGLADGVLALVDATGVAADATAVTIDAATQGSIQMDSAPTVRSDTPAGAAMSSMFQTNSTALRASVVLGAELLRDTAIAEVTGITWGGP
jgi:HK97 family phage major capsid protein